MRGSRPWLAGVAAGLFACVASRETLLPPRSTQVVNPQTLAAPESFDALPPAQRAAALFLEAIKVLLHPRCTNCHPPDDRPRQRDGQAHEPPVARDVVGMRCGSCHQDHNLQHARLPGAPHWSLAPKEAVWLGKSASEICAQLKDRRRNGEKTLAEIVEHASHDPLVGWAWSPGADREPAPGTQARFGALLSAWMQAGADCPKE